MTRNIYFFTFDHSYICKIPDTLLQIHFPSAVLTLWTKSLFLLFVIHKTKTVGQKLRKKCIFGKVFWLRPSIIYLIQILRSSNRLNVINLHYDIKYETIRRSVCRYSCIALYFLYMRQLREKKPEKKSAEARKHHTFFRLNLLKL